MSKRWWLLGLVVLVLAGLLLACGSNYSTSTDGLLVVASEYSGLLETFSFNLNKGSVSAVYNTPADTSNETCVLNGQPSSLVMAPSGNYVYAIINGNSTCGTTGATIAAFAVNSDGTLKQAGSPVPLAPLSITIQDTNEKVPVVPNSMFMDAAGKFLFIANLSTTDNSNNPIPGTVSVLLIGSGGSLTEVEHSPFSVPTAEQTPDIVAVAATPTVFPSIGVNGQQNAVCSLGQTPPTAEYLYAVDAVNYVVWEFAVNTSTGVLSPPTGASQSPSFATDKIPAGVAVDPCDRFVYVSDSLYNKVSAYTICDGLATQSTLCETDSSQYPAGALVQVTGSPYSLGGNANGAGPIAVDPYGKNVYVVGTESNTISPLTITAVTGGLTALNPPVQPTGVGPASIAIRGDDNWLFVANHGSVVGDGGNTVSQYSITPETGVLAVMPAIQTDNYPWGVAVK
jgi:6-phosphogluconolactonase (cycloisomerase 2 family)